MVNIKLSFLSSLPISVLRNLESEANKLYDGANKLYKAALLTRCYVQHFLSPYIDSGVNHKQHFIKIPFINKGMEFIDLHSILKDKDLWHFEGVSAYFSDFSQNVPMHKIWLISFWIGRLMYKDRIKVKIRQVDPYDKTGYHRGKELQNLTSPKH